MRAFVAFLLLACVSVLTAAGPDLTDGVSVLLMLAGPYGANTGLWFNQFERLGWEVTVTGTEPTVRNCSTLCTPIDVDVTIGEIEAMDEFDAVVISTTKGTAAPTGYPARDLRESEAALDLIRAADARGLTLAESCSGFLVLQDAGVLDGHRVVIHPRIESECGEPAGECVQGGLEQLPIIDGNIVTGTSARFFAQEYAEAIARSLDLTVRRPGAGEPIIWSDVVFEVESQDLGGPVTASWTLGTTRPDGALGLCEVDGDAVVVGYTWSERTGSADVLVLRCSETGEVRWAKAVGDTGRDYGQDVCRSADGDLLVVGYTTSQGEGSEDVLLVRLGADGTAKWARTYGGEGPDAGFGITPTADGGFVLCGRTAASVDDWSDLYVIKVDADGEEIWSRTIGGDGLDRGHAAAEGPDGTLYIAGGTTSEGAGNYDLLLVLLDADGREIARRVDGYRWFETAEDVVIAEDGRVIVAGYGDQERADPNNMMVIGFSAMGEREWHTRIGGPRSFDYGQSIVGLDGGDLLVCGAMTAEMTTRNDVYLARLTSDGDVVWESGAGLESSNEWASAACRLSSGSILVAGHATAGGAGMNDVLLLVVDPQWTP